MGFLIAAPSSATTIDGPPRSSSANQSAEWIKGVPFRLSGGMFVWGKVRWIERYLQFVCVRALARSLASNEPSLQLLAAHADATPTARTLELARASLWRLYACRCRPWSADTRACLPVPREARERRKEKWSRPSRRNHCTLASGDRYSCLANFCITFLLLVMMAKPATSKTHTHAKL